MQMVKESLDEGYCDVSGRAGTWTLLARVQLLSCDLLLIFFVPLSMPNLQVACVMGLITTGHSAGCAARRALRGTGSG